MTMDFRQLEVTGRFGEKPFNVIGDNRLVGRLNNWTEVVTFIQNQVSFYKKITIVEYIKK